MEHPGPHRIPHDHKHQSQGDFGFSPGSGVLEPFSYGNSDTRKESIFSDNDSTLMGSSKRISNGSEVPPKLDYDEKPPKFDAFLPLENPRRRRRYWPWLILIILVSAVIAILTAFLVTRYRSDGGGIPGNSSAVSTIIVVTSQSLTSITITQGGATITTVTSEAPSTVTAIQSLEPTTTTVLSQPTATVAPVQGFDTYRFYNGDVMMVYESHGSIWTKQYQGGWNSPTLITSGAKPGTSVRLFGWVETDTNNDYDEDGYYIGSSTSTYGLTYWTVYFVDTNSILQEMVMAFASSNWSSDYDAQLPVMSNTWYAGYLGTEGYKWEVSETMYFETCAWGPLLQSETEAAGYIYLDAVGGGITKLGTSLSNWWAITDLPNLVAGSSKAITCASRVDQIENLWLINQDGDLEQWWLNAKVTGDNEDSPLDWNQGIKYSGPFATNTSLETWSTPLSDIIFYQAPNNSIMFFNVLGEGATAHISSSGIIAANADGGTDLATAMGATTAPSIANYENATFDIFYVYFQSGAAIEAEKMEPDPSTGITVVIGAGSHTNGSEGAGVGNSGDGDGSINISGTSVTRVLGGSAAVTAVFIGFGVTFWLLL